ncbi:MAG TPA: DUF1801 domain-containing protein [Cyclobacteriaceae bacterium]|nr:DUF1801 domain-containing protein [Cyclobacteriaceae bacterium]HRK52612.1 DUF1801 domain-containing protein [Cyclobacteriaceae bacterium]
MERVIDNFYINQNEPNKSCLLTLREIILNLDSNISTTWKYAMPFFCYKGKMFCYLRLDKKTNEPYIGIVEGNRIGHPLLEKGNRKRMKVMRINPNDDIDIAMINQVLNKALDFYRKGIIKTKK